MKDPNEFVQRTKDRLAGQAGFRCSICKILTIAASDESEDGLTRVGEAAHIRGGKPGTRRYLSTMTSAQRSNITNGIWLCATHAKHVDDDEIYYTVERLQQIRANHIAECKAEIRKAKVELAGGVDLLGIGPNCVVRGEIVELTAISWTIRIDEFVTGDLSSLAAYGEGLTSLPEQDRYIISNSLGDGRVLSGQLTIANRAGASFVSVQTEPRFPRIEAAQLGSQLAIGADNDLVVDRGQIGRISGIASLPQVVRQTLSLRRGESPFYPFFGSRLAEIVETQSDPALTKKLLTLEVVRLASIPLARLSGERATQLQCVERVRSIAIDPRPVKPNWFSAALALDVKGVGLWEVSMDICLPPPDAVSHAAAVRRSMGLEET